MAGKLAKTPNFDAQGQARCGVAHSQDRPLTIEWPSADRGALEAKVGRAQGLVAVRYVGCEMAVLERCKVPGQYAYHGFEPKREDQMFRSADDLYAKIPLGAAQLEATLERHGDLALQTMLVGQWLAERSQVRRSELRGDCEAATHVITGAVVGAFRLSAGAGADIAGSASVRGWGGGGGHSSAARSFERSDGDPQSCERSDDEPREGCAALLRLVVEPISEPADIAAKRPCPSGSVRVEGGRDVSDFCLDRYEVSVGDYAACARREVCSAAATTVLDPTLGDAERAAEDKQCNSNGNRHPVNCVNWHQAQAYCKARGGRLPSEAEWAWAARGGEQQRTYPWGEQEPTAKLVNACGAECKRYFERTFSEPWPKLYDQKDGAVATAAVGSYARGAGRSGVHDLAGNVWEWTASPAVKNVSTSDAWDGGGEGRGGPEGGYYATRGGSFLSTEESELRSTARVVRPAKQRRADVGFRCAYDG